MRSSELRARVLEFPQSSDNELRRVMNEIESFAPEILGMKGFSMFDSLSEVKRAGWIRKEVGIPFHLAESVMSHSENTKTAAECLIEGSPEKVDKPATLPRKLKLHDLPEYHRILPDITPHDDYTQEQKDLLERYAVLEMERILGEEGGEDVALIREFIEGKTPNAKIGKILDKLDAGVKALAYENMGYGERVSIFHPYTRDKISHDAHFLDIYDILLEREYREIDPHLQYFSLLKNGGDYNDFRLRMKEINDKIRG